MVHYAPHTQPGYIDTHSKLGRGKVTFWQPCRTITKIYRLHLWDVMWLFACASMTVMISLVGCCAT